MLKNHPLHEKATELVKNYLKVEHQLIECIQSIDKGRIFQLLGYSSLFQYAVSLGLSEGQAYTLIGVARKCVEVPSLQVAIQSGALSVSKARKIVSVITTSNSEAWIQKAIEMPLLQLEREVACLGPDTAIADRFRPVSSQRVEMRVGVSPDLEKRIRRVQEIVGSKDGTTCSLERSFELMVESYLSRHDPIELAKRAKPFVPKQTEQFSRTVALKPALRRQVLLRDQGQCRQLRPDGKRCCNRLWIEVHHLISRCDGGSDAIDNLITLCGFHHRLQHDNHGRDWAARSRQMQG